MDMDTDMNTDHEHGSHLLLKVDATFSEGEARHEIEVEQRFEELVLL